MHLGSLTRISWTRYRQTFSYQLNAFALNLQQYQIDYVAHDEDPYVSAGIDDVYGYCKAQGASFPSFSPSHRPPPAPLSLPFSLPRLARLAAFDSPQNVPPHLRHSPLDLGVAPR